MIRRITNSDHETFALGILLAKKCRGGEVIALTGELGAGKTVFTKGVAAGLKIKKLITSPTFTVMNVYPVQHKTIRQLVHIDCYRITNPKELAALGVQEYFNDPVTVTVVEWAERAKTILTKPTYTIRLELKDETRRIITIISHA